jgi:hypothetical protein
MVYDPKTETVSTGSLTTLKFEFADVIGEYEAIWETVLGCESGP